MLIITTEKRRIGEILALILLILFIFINASPLFAQDGILRKDSDTFAPSVHFEETKLEIEKVKEEHDQKLSEISSKIEKIKKRIIESGDKNERERLMKLLSILEDKRLLAVKTAVLKVSDLRVKDTEKKLTALTIDPPKEQPPKYLDPSRWLASNGLFDIFEAKPEFGGYIKTRLTADLEKDNDFEDLFEAHPKAYVKLKYPINDKLSFFISAHGQYDYYTGGSTRYDHEIALDEAYLDIFFDKFDIRIGNQIFAWGRTDSINPTDNLNSMNINNAIMGDIGEEIIPTFAVKFDYYLNNTTFEFVVVPFFQENKFDIIGSDWAIFRHGMFTDLMGGFFPFTSILDDETQKQLNRLSLSFFSPTVPTDSPENTQGGLRISSTFKGWDFSISYINAFDKFPTLHLSEDLAEAIEDNTVEGYITGLTPGEIPGILELKYHRYNMIGLDFASNVGKYGLRGEAAIFFDRYCYTEELKTIKTNQLLYVLGVDRQFKGNFYVNLQLIQRIIMDYQHEILEDEVLSALTLYTYKKFLNEKLNVELRVFYNLNDGDVFITPRATYKYTDSLEFTIGMNILEGDEATIFGHFDNNDQFFFEIKYYF